MDRRDGCLTLQGIRDNSANQNGEFHQARVKAANDRMAILKCPGGTAESGEDSYEPRYSWQRRCLEVCEKNLGPQYMKKTEHLSSWVDCDGMAHLAQAAADAEHQDDFSTRKEWYNAAEMAILDKYDSMNCQ